MDDKIDKVIRILTIYERLILNQVVNKQDMVTLFNVDEKTIRRDIDDIRSYLSNNISTNGIIDVKYRRDQKGYFLTKKDNRNLNKEDVLAITKILLESRAFSKEEMVHLINVLMTQIDNKQRKYIKELIGNEILNFVPLQHNKNLLPVLWELSEYIRHKEVIEVTYIKTSGVEVKRSLNPVSIIFSEYYFYLIAYFNKSKFDNPTVFRIDRIKSYKATGSNFSIPYAERFEDGEFRKRVQFMYIEDLMKIKFEFLGESTEAILDRLPTAHIVETLEDKFIIEAEVYGNGIIMWLLTQGSNIKILSPEYLREEVKYEIEKLRKLYDM